MDGLGQNGVIQVVPPAALEAQLARQAATSANVDAQPIQGDVSQLGSYIRAQFEIFRNHRNTSAGWSERMLMALRTFNGQYDANKLQEIRKFGGSEIYARLIAQKCRAASSLLRDVYLGADRPWGLRPPADPDIDSAVTASIKQLMLHESAMVAQQTGQPPNRADIENRARALYEQAKEVAKKKAADQADDSEDRLEEILREGGFYHALAEFIVDLPIFPFAVLKGPVVRIYPQVVWPNAGGMPSIQQIPRLTWQRVSPFDLWFTPGVADIANADCIEKLRVTRAELNELLDLPGYNQQEILAVLDEYGRGGLYDNWDTTDAERSVLESRENPAWNRSAMLSMMEFNGNCQGRLLQDYGLAVPDELRDYNVQTWMVGSHVIKSHLSPSPRMRHPYFITSYEKVPGTPVGNGLTDLLTDMQEASNACLRSLINNLSIASGPQVMIDLDQIAEDENPEELYPWKRWKMRKNPLGSGGISQPISFFQPTSNAQALIEVFNKFVDVADDVSAIPKYIQGGQAGGAGRTASGLAMLMGNSSKILQSVSANIDRDIIDPALHQLIDLVLLTDQTGMLSGEENVTVLGANVAIQRETQRQRQIEFLQGTTNPLDQRIMGIKGRGIVLRSVAQTIGLSEDIVPNDDKLDQMQQADQQHQQAGPIDAQVQKGVMQGVTAGVQRITQEMVAGGLAQHEALPEGPPIHIGTPPGAVDPRPTDLSAPGTPTPGAPPGAGGPGSPGLARQASGMKVGPQATAHMGPTTALVGNQPGPNAMPIHGGVG